MRTDHRHSAMTLLEVLVALTLVLILVGALGGLGVHLKKQSEVRLTESTIDVLVTAIEQFHSDSGAFPFQTYDHDVPPDGIDHEYNSQDLEQKELVENGIPADILPPGLHLDMYASSEALYYFLSRSPNSAAIIDSLVDRMVTSKDGNGINMTILIGGPVAGGGRIVDLIRFVDVWGMPIRYAYDPDDPLNPADPYDAFPILTSAGPDKRFDTPDDIRN